MDKGRLAWASIAGRDRERRGRSFTGFSGRDHRPNGWKNRAIDYDGEVATLGLGVAVVLLVSPVNGENNVICGQTIEAGALRLACEGGDLDDLRQLGQFKRLEHLTLKSVALKSLEGIQQVAPTLRTLELSDVSLKDLRPLSALTRLETLHLYDTHTTDLSALRALKGLVELEVTDSDLADIDPIADLPRLQLLNLRNTEVEDIVPLTRLRSLITLGLRNTEVANLSPLTAHPRLEVLDIVETNVRRIGALTRVPRLRVLVFEPSSIRRIGPISRIENLLAVGVPAKRPKSHNRFMSVQNPSSVSGGGSNPTTDPDGSIRRLSRLLPDRVTLYRLGDNGYRLGLLKGQMIK